MHIISEYLRRKISQFNLFQTFNNLEGTKRQTAVHKQKNVASFFIRNKSQKRLFCHKKIADFKGWSQSVRKD